MKYNGFVCKELKQDIFTLDLVIHHIKGETMKSFDKVLKKEYMKIMKAYNIQFN